MAHCWCHNSFHCLLSKRRVTSVVTIWYPIWPGLRLQWEKAGPRRPPEVGQMHGRFWYPFWHFERLQWKWARAWPCFLFTVNGVLVLQYANPRSLFSYPVSLNEDGECNRHTNRDRGPWQQFKFLSLFACPLNPLPIQQHSEGRSTCSGVSAVPLVSVLQTRSSQMFVLSNS